MHILYQHCTIGATGKDIENIMKAYLTKHHLRSAFKGYHWFPGELCLSLNDCIVHGIPDRTILKPWDLLKVDVGIDYRGAISDSAFSIVIGWAATNPDAQKLIDVTKESLDSGLKKVGPGQYLSWFAEVVSQHITSNGQSIIKDLTWHGVGTSLHEDPYIYNYPHPHTYKTKFETNMVVALEPITAQTSQSFIEDPTNGWNLYTEQGDLWAQREYTVLITDNGVEVLAGLQKAPY